MKPHSSSPNFNHAANLFSPWAAIELSRDKNAEGTAVNLFSPWGDAEGRGGTIMPPITHLASSPFYLLPNT
ncbi:MULTISPECIES: hypothetical protein [unclassified Carboxylicivirga]|uniref:hypothetical protein n=1 Tax=Carboxylicivirga TaxID=1628153 RepID=UPI003D33DEB9